MTPVPVGVVIEKSSTYRTP